MIDTKVPRMTKRIKQFKPRQGLTKSEVQTLVAYIKEDLGGYEWMIGHYKHVAESCKGNNKEMSELYFKKTDKARKQRNKLSLIQAKLKRGLV